MAAIISLIFFVFLFTVGILRCCQYLKHFSKVNIIYTRQFASSLSLSLSIYLFISSSTLCLRRACVNICTDKDVK